MPSELGNKFSRISGQLKPVINLKTGQRYNSINAAERGDGESRATIKISCIKGKMLLDGTRYAFINIDDQPELTEGHRQEHYIGQSARKIKELTSGQIFNNAVKAAKNITYHPNQFRHMQVANMALQKKAMFFVIWTKMASK